MHGESEFTRAHPKCTSAAAHCRSKLEVSNPSPWPGAEPLVQRAALLSCDWENPVLKDSEVGNVYVAARIAAVSRHGQVIAIGDAALVRRQPRETLSKVIHFTDRHPMIVRAPPARYSICAACPSICRGTYPVVTVRCLCYEGPIHVCSEVGPNTRLPQRGREANFILTANCNYIPQASQDM